MRRFAVLDASILVSLLAVAALVVPGCSSHASHSNSTSPGTPETGDPKAIGGTSAGGGAGHAAGEGQNGGAAAGAPDAGGSSGNQGSAGDINVAGGAGAGGSAQDLTCRNLVAHWPADGNTRDVVGTNHAELADGATFAEGKVGQAFSFDGAGSFVTQQTLPLASSGDWTYALWINISSYRDGQIGIGDGSYFLDRTTDSIPVVSLKPVGGKFGFQVRYDDRTGVGGAVGGEILLRTWTHVAMQRKRGQPFQLYVNGISVGTYPDSGGALTPPPIKLGRNSSFADSGFSGLIDELQVYDVALTDTELRALATMQACK